MRFDGAQNPLRLVHVKNYRIGLDWQMPIGSRDLSPPARFAGSLGSWVRIVTLRRSQKKRPVAFVADGIGASTTRSFAWSATCPVVGIASTWSCRCAG